MEDHDSGCVSIGVTTMAVDGSTLKESVMLIDLQIDQNTVRDIGSLVSVTVS